MSEHYDFHYQPTGSGAISGQQVLQQTEDAINELGDYVYDNVGGAMDVAQEALETAQNAQNDAQTALDTANSFSSAIQSAQQDASTALSTAQTAQTTASNANATAIQASQDASSAVTTANNASGQVSTLSGTVTAIGQRVTTAEGNIGQNTSDITALTTRVGTAEGNITTLQNDVSIAQGNASSAMATAGTVKQQSYVLRYSSTTLVASSTNSNSLLDNTDNLKVGDKVIDSSGVIYSVTAIDTANSTFTIGTALIDLANDSDVVHKSGNETIGGEKTFQQSPIIFNSNASIQDDVPNLLLKNPLVERASTTLEGEQGIKFVDKNANNIASIVAKTYTSGISDIILTSYSENNGVKTTGLVIRRSPTTSKFYPFSDNITTLGETNRRWSRVYANEYYYGSDNIEFSTKFVTTDTNQIIASVKSFSATPIIYNSDTTANIPNLIFKNATAEKGGSLSENQVMFFVDKQNKTIASLRAQVGLYGQSLLLLRADNVDSSDNPIYCGMTFSANKNGTKNIVPNTNGDTDFGTVTTKWKSFNGLEPSSLSLPSGNLNDIIDISSYLTTLDGSSANTYQAPANGYVSITMSNSSGIQAYINGLWGHQVVRPSVGGIRFLMPILKDKIVNILIFGGTIDNARFIPCQGNV